MFLSIFIGFSWMFHMFFLYHIPSPTPSQSRKKPLLRRLVEPWLRPARHVARRAARHVVRRRPQRVAGHAATFGRGGGGPGRTAELGGAVKW